MAEHEAKHDSNGISKLWVWGRNEHGELGIGNWSTNTQQGDASTNDEVDNNYTIGRSQEHKDTPFPALPQWGEGYGSREEEYTPPEPPKGLFFPSPIPLSLPSSSSDRSSHNSAQDDDGGAANVVCSLLLEPIDWWCGVLVSYG